MSNAGTTQRQRPNGPTTLDGMIDAEIQRMRREARPQVPEQSDVPVGSVIAALTAKEIGNAARDNAALQRQKAQAVKHGHAIDVQDGRRTIGSDGKF